VAVYYEIDEKGQSITSCPHRKKSAVSKDVIWVGSSECIDCEYCSRYSKKDYNIFCDNPSEIKKAEVPAVNFKELYDYLQLCCIHRQFSGTDVSLLALFCVFEILHNFSGFIDDVNEFERIKDGDAVPPDHHWNNLTWYEHQLIMLERGSICVRPEVWKYLSSKKRMSEKKRKTMIKEAAREALKDTKVP